jgi:glutamyl-tRNA synthetase
MAESARYCYEDFDEIDAKAAKKNLRPVVLEPLQAARDALAELDDWDAKSIDEAIHSVAESFEINLGKLGQPIRVAVTGGSVSPPIDTTVWLVGKDRTINRLDQALELVKIRAASS